VSLLLFARELYAAALFGRSASMDAFVIALMIPASLAQMMAGAAKATFIPAYLRLREGATPRDAEALFGSASVLLLLLLALATLLVGFLGLPLLDLLGVEVPRRPDLLASLFTILLALIVLAGVHGLWAAHAEASGRFFAPAMSRAAVPLGGLLFLALLADSWGIEALAVGTVVGTFVQLGALGWSLRHRGVQLRPRWRGMTPALRTIVSQYWRVFGGSAILATTLVVDKGMATSLGEGAVSSLSYGQRAIGFALSIGGVAIGTVALPFASKLIARGEFDRLAKTIKVFLALTALAGIPTVALLIVGSEPLVRLLFERGAFTSDDTVHVALVQSMYALQIPFYLAGIFFARVISAFQHNQYLLYINVFSVGANVGFNLLFMGTMGAAGLALSTSVVYLLASVINGIVAARLLSQARQRSQMTSRDSRSRQRRG